MWPDIELAVMKGMRTHLTGVRVTDEVPPKVETLGPVSGKCLHVDGGGVAGVAVGAARHLHDDDRAAMWQLAERARQAVHALAASVAGDVVIDTVDTVQRPVPVPYGNPAVRRAIATYTLTTRASTHA
ncbi:hypothetical protein [Streptomyces scabiei]|uniref:hypothetical protein n=1 Tax=Streptomyces scabiei TaxID=1930 RepID=UPI0029AC1224|nr:hypothetical protein [Streptomyces scabiei]MDX2863214.1 hypothetical protein [Streptomyces scabiei]